jgi:hypothetical protein
MPGKDYDRMLIGQGVALVPRPRGTTVVSAGFKWTEVRDEGTVPSLEETSKWQDVDRAAISGINGLVVLDWDSFDDRLRFWNKKTAEAMPTETLVVKSRRGVAEWFFDSQAKDAVRKLLGHVPDEIDFRPAMEFELFVGGHLASCPGNLHWDGITVYRPLGTLNILRKDGIVEQILRRMVEDFNWKPPVRGKSGRLNLEAIRNGVVQGQRSNSCFWYAVHLLDCLKFDLDSALFELQRWNALNKPPLSQKEFESQVASAANWTERKQRIRKRRVVRRF